MKKILITIAILLVVLGGFFYFKNKSTSTGGGTSSGFKNFFNFGSKSNPSDTTGPGNETTSDFTTDTPSQTGEQTSNGGTGTGTSSPFGTTSPFTPSATTGGVDLGGGIAAGGVDIGTGGGTGGIDIGTGGGIGVDTGGGSGTGGGTGGGVSQCTSDDTVIEFTPEEIARLQALEQRFYALAPSLHTDTDVQVEIANYTSYKLLNQKYSELITYCENKAPLLSSSINRRVSTPLYTNASANAFFTDGPEADGVIDINSTTPKLREIEKFFRINIW